MSVLAFTKNEEIDQLKLPFSERFQLLNEAREVMTIETAGGQA